MKAMKRARSIDLLLFTSVLIAFSACNCFAQSACSLLDKNKKAQFITYEGYSDLQAFKLRLTNNTSCSIIIQRGENVPILFVKLPSGKTQMQFPDKAKDGTIVGLNYYVQHREHKRVPEPGVSWGDSVYTYEIPAGQSVIFSVLPVHFKRRLDIVVPFKYEWESGDSIGIGVGGINHYVYFLAGDLPEEVVKIAKRCCR